jgi:hypothetical protein
LNLSKRGASISVGERGAHVTLNTRGEVTETIGAPGTGIFYTTRQRLRGPTGPGGATGASWALAFLFWAAIWWAVGLGALAAIITFLTR